MNLNRREYPSDSSYFAISSRTEHIAQSQQIKLHPITLEDWPWTYLMMARAMFSTIKFLADGQRPLSIKDKS